MAPYCFRQKRSHPSAWHTHSPGVRLPLILWPHWCPPRLPHSPWVLVMTNYFVTAGCLSSSRVYPECTLCQRLSLPCSNPHSWLSIPGAILIIFLRRSLTVMCFKNYFGWSDHSYQWSVHSHGSREAGPRDQVRCLMTAIQETQGSRPRLPSREQENQKATMGVREIPRTQRSWRRSL